jgi:Fe-S-cluster containining protein
MTQITWCFSTETAPTCAWPRPGTAQHVFSCSIYERRPTTCRTLERGSAACEAERERKGARPGDLVQLRLSQR